MSLVFLMSTYKASLPIAFKSSIPTSLKKPEKQKLCSPPSKSFSAKKQPMRTRGQSLTHHNCTISDFTVHTTYIYMSVHTHACICSHVCTHAHSHIYVFSFIHSICHSHTYTVLMCAYHAHLYIETHPWFICMATYSPYKAERNQSSRLFHHGGQPQGISHLWEKSPSSCLSSVQVWDLI